MLSALQVSCQVFRTGARAGFAAQPAAACGAHDEMLADPPVVGDGFPAPAQRSRLTMKFAIIARVSPRAPSGARLASASSHRRLAVALASSIPSRLG